MAFDTGMLWWASSVVFCASILAAAWIKRSELIELHKGYLLWLWAIVLCFFGTIVFYGIWITSRIMNLQSEVEQLLKDVDFSISMSEFDTLIMAHYIGTSSFILVFITWFSFIFLLEIKKSDNINS